MALFGGKHTISISFHVSDEPLAENALFSYSFALDASVGDNSSEFWSTVREWREKIGEEHECSTQKSPPRFILPQQNILYTILMTFYGALNDHTLTYLTTMCQRHYRRIQRQVHPACAHPLYMNPKLLSMLFKAANFVGKSAHEKSKSTHPDDDDDDDDDNELT